MNNQEKGIHGETSAIRYLINLGYTIEASRYRNQYGELDIIATKGEWIYGIEVKFVRSLDEDFHPFMKINSRKLERMVKVMQTYISINLGLSSLQQSFCLIVVDGKSKVEFYSDLLV